MERRRADKRPGVLARVRWANLGRSAALLAAGLIVVTRGCGGPGVAPAARIPALPPALAAPVSVGPPVADPGAGPDPGSREAGAVRRRKRHRRRGGRRKGRDLRVAGAAPRVAPAPAWIPPRRLPEFFP